MAIDPAITKDLYGSARLAAGYAFRRPRVHERLLERAARQWDATFPLGRALDVGCGAGVSTAALEPYARRVVGLDPARAMLAHTRTVAPAAHFVVAPAELLPFGDASFDLIAAAGAINYAEVPLFLSEARRTLTTDGLLVLYDFSRGRRMSGTERLERWNRTFDERYPSARGYHLDVRTLDYPRFGLSLDGYQEIAVSVPMERDAYLDYVMSETCVELAIAGGAAEDIIRDWCEETLQGVFEDRGPRDVWFDGYVAHVRPK